MSPLKEVQRSARRGLLSSNLEFDKLQGSSTSYSESSASLLSQAHPGQRLRSRSYRRRGLVVVLPIVKGSGVMLKFQEVPEPSKFRTARSEFDAEKFLYEIKNANFIGLSLDFRQTISLPDNFFHQAVLKNLQSVRLENDTGDFSVKSLDDAALIESKWENVNLSSSAATEITPKGVSEVIRQWARSERRIGRIYLRLSMDQAFQLDDVLEGLQNLPVKLCEEDRTSYFDVEAVNLLRKDGKSLRIWCDQSNHVYLFDVTKMPPSNVRCFNL